MSWLKPLFWHTGQTGSRVPGWTKGILDWREVMLQGQVITQVKVQGQHFGPKEATWEDEQTMKEFFSNLFLVEEHRDDVRS